MKSFRHSLAPLLLSGVAHAAEPVFVPIAPAAAPKPAAAVPATKPQAAALTGSEAKSSSAWSTAGKIGIYGSSVVTGGTGTSRDPTIAASKETLSYRIAFECAVDWKQDRHSVDQDLNGKYGRKKNQNASWIEDTDEVRYDGVYRYSFHAPHFTYGSWGWESVFTGPLPEEAYFTPGLLKAAVGYGQRYQPFLFETMKAEARLGAAARKRYGSNYTSVQREVETGLEAYARLEQKIIDVWSWFMQYEGFSEFDDLGHVTNLGTAGFTAQLNKYLVIELGLRVYYETRPEDVIKTGNDGYNSLSGRQDTLVGLTYAW